MAGTVAVTYLPRVGQTGRETNVVQIDWTSDASGNADSSISLHGYLIKAVTDPGAAAPTDNYDITLVQFGVDALSGLLADRDTANNEQVYTTPTNSAVPVYLAGDHTFTIANAGNAKNGTVYLFMVDSL